MMIRQKTEQETFWEGKFGTEYTDRVRITPELRQPFFAEVLDKVQGVKTVCELGANRGHNLQAILNLDSKLQLTGVELNKVAISELKKISNLEVFCSSIQEFKSGDQYDLVFTCGVLIHISPEDLGLVYKKMNEISSRYILINEYYNPKPVEIDYRGHSGKLFKRDFASEFIEENECNYSVVDYGFLWKRIHPAWDDTTWFLLEKIEKTS